MLQYLRIKSTHTNVWCFGLTVSELRIVQVNVRYSIWQCWECCTQWKQLLQIHLHTYKGIKAKSNFCTFSHACAQVFAVGRMTKVVSFLSVYYIQVFQYIHRCIQSLIFQWIEVQLDEWATCVCAGCARMRSDQMR